MSGQNVVGAGVSPEVAAGLKKLIREVPDFPKPGILFYDITTLLKDPAGLRTVTAELRRRYEQDPPDLVLGIESRGFVFGALLAGALDRGFVLVRKPGKLPAETLRETYDLEYGQDSVEIHRDAIQNGQRVLIVDDLLATGGTAAAVSRLVNNLGGRVAGLAFVVELTFLSGRQKLRDYDVFTLLEYDK
jgi:adenine phosphoribosyltransferase